jgi:hypothetical protein
MWDIACTKIRAPAAGTLVAAAVLASCAEPSAPAVGSADTPVAGTPAGFIARTRLSIDGTGFRINGTITYPQQAAEGLLMNVRMANAVFEDPGRPEFDPNANTQEFLDRMREYVGLGVRAFTISLQGGNPGYEGASNSAFSSNGGLKAGYMGRVARVIERADALRAVIILSLFYQRQDQRLADEEAVRRGVVQAVDWVKRKGYRNVVLEIANEYGHSGFDHAVLRTDAGVAGLVRLAKNRYPALPVSSSYVRSGETTSRVASASDLLLVHFNTLSASDIPAHIRALRAAHPGKPIVCNEDGRTGSSAAAAASASVGGGASYGLLVTRVNQVYPFDFHGRRDDPAAYDRYVALTR